MHNETTLRTGLAAAIARLCSPRGLARRVGANRGIKAALYDGYVGAYAEFYRQEHARQDATR